MGLLFSIIMVTSGIFWLIGEGFGEMINSAKADAADQQRMYEEMGEYNKPIYNHERQKWVRKTYWRGQDIWIDEFSKIIGKGEVNRLILKDVHSIYVLLIDLTEAIAKKEGWKVYGRNNLNNFVPLTNWD